MDKVEYRKLHVEEISRELFRDFIRHQKVTKCLRRQDGEWVVKDDPFIDDWSEEDYRTLVSCLKNTEASYTPRLQTAASKHLRRWRRRHLAGSGNTSICPASMFPRSSGGRVLEGRYFVRQRNGRGSGARKNSIFRRIPRSKPRRFTRRWGASRRRSTIRSMSRRSLMIVRWNAVWMGRGRKKTCSRP